MVLDSVIAIDMVGHGDSSLETKGNWGRFSVGMMVLKMSLPLLNMKLQLRVISKII